MKPPDDSNISYQGTGAKQPPKPQAPGVKAPPIVWPRLDPGAVLCRSQEDLQRRAANLRGEQGGPADCRLINAPVGIQIVQRNGPGQTEVRLANASKEVGWTDVWLPATPPRGTATISAQ